VRLSLNKINLDVKTSATLKKKDKTLGCTTQGSGGQQAEDQIRQGKQFTRLMLRAPMDKSHNI
jgi:hypothetical protein